MKKHDECVGFLWWITQRNIKVLFTKPKTGSMYSIKLIKEIFPKTLPRRFQGLIVGRKREGFTPVTPFLELYVSSYRIKTSPNDHVLYGIHTNKKIQSKWCASTFCCHTIKTLYVYILFHKRDRGRMRRKMALQKLATNYHY